MIKINYTVKELIEVLKSLPQSQKVQLDAEGAIYDEFHVEQASNRVVIFTEGEPSF